MLIEEYHTQSILRDFQIANRSTGVVTTTRITHATPAGAYAHIADRDWENDDAINNDGEDSEACDDIAEQLVFGETGTNLKVAMGGGRSGFLPNEITDEDGNPGQRDDGKNLKNIWLASHNTDGNTGVYVGHRDDLLAVNASETDYLLGLFSPSHMDYKLDTRTVTGEQPTLEEMTEKAIEILQKDPNGFFLFVEGGLIDWAHHDNEANVAMEEGIEFEKAITKAFTMTSPEDTLIVVTADHGQPITINGYPLRHEYILGLTGPSDQDNMLYNILMYTNGPGFRTQSSGKRPDSASEDYEDPHFAYPSTVPIEFSNHNGEDVVIYAKGPFAHLFSGTHENSYIPQVFRYAACVGEGLHYCDEL
ncbi:Membrane-bound alkaline phosphatase [Armadillidium nasatum]|uniref:alkaline phosphatase n=1 Tax=Armadillidium nasatum TaxID=96803 RepID=A0A5N5TDG6_9CRUS|nr:Membrane-bound alkaline phosphatase [Armadillidium nasatum]